MKDTLTVKLFAVDRTFAPMECDDVQLPIQDSLDGTFSGSYGVQKGHAPAVFSLKAGLLQLLCSGKMLFQANISDGFATVENNEVCITAESIQEA